MSISPEAFNDGHLEIGLEECTLISVPSTADLEPWEISWTADHRLDMNPMGEVFPRALPVRPAAPEELP